MSTTQTSTAPRAAVYLRVSLDATGEMLAVERQREDCRKIAANRGWTVTGEYVDNSISASDSEKVRPAYERMVQDYRDGAFDALVCWDLDRLTRQPRQLEDWIEAAEKRRLQLVTANGEADLSTDGGQLFARVKVSVARSEVQRKAARQKRALQQRAEKGRPPLGVRLTGYTTSGDLVPDEAEMVRGMFAAFNAGESLRGICRMLATQGHTTRRGKPWSPSTVRSILTNPRYAGHAVYCGKVLDTAQDVSWEPLVSPDVFALVQHRLADPRRAMNREGTDRKHLGSGLYRCACGLPVRGWSGHRYRCVDGCHSRSGRNVDAFVRDVIEERLSRPDLGDVLASRIDNAKADVLLAESHRLQARLATIEADYDAELIDGRRYAASTAKVKASLQRVEVERARLLAGVGPAAILTAKDPVAAFRSASLMRQRAVIDFFVTVTLHGAARGSKTFDPSSVGVEWKVAS
ncbi:recombinase family protein [Intrasporangium sp. DVR]|uniref:recombinase family protein n=1 Tax=Intrasporangium sp. DVR TaxID=3127867 RepID=UPI00313A694E